jgi:phosphoribosyl-ATP pyrophosphohydrolase
MSEVLERLEGVVADRIGGDPSSSYVARLAADPALAARKLGEEAVETVVASFGADPVALTAEAADVVFHLMVLLAAKGVRWSAVEAELARREGVSGLAEKASR